MDSTASASQPQHLFSSKASPEQQCAQRQAFGELVRAVAKVTDKSTAALSSCPTASANQSTVQWIASATIIARANSAR